MVLTSPCHAIVLLLTSEKVLQWEEVAPEATANKCFINGILQKWDPGP